MWNDTIELAREYSRQAEHVDPSEAWTPQDSSRAADALLMLVQAETLRRTSRLTVDADRPRLAAIARNDN
ncbi:hypothetical protein [Amycolatopsis sp. DSM 110486]|uniref:hypothetical protein n=1 Tax=Amycolatopsis sp. DSM 110486 TaxID=2865832 RepID=UPI001C69E409|nr:hypothetical protein K1T34_39435 [Amycolatopsis sp. DSM 110486]